MGGDYRYLRNTSRRGLQCDSGLQVKETTGISDVQVGGDNRCPRISSGWGVRLSQDYKWEKITSISGIQALLVCPDYK